MLSKEHRLQKNKDFEHVFKRARFSSSQNLNVRVVKTSSEKETRFGFIISNKVNKLATRRNALKRQLREIVRLLIYLMPKGYDVVVTVKRDFPFPYDQNEIKEELLRNLKKLSLFTDEKNTDKNN